MLTGLENIPRITELREIREQYISGRKRQALRDAGIDPDAGRHIDGTSRLPADMPASGTGYSGKRDEMIVVPGKKRADDRDVQSVPEGQNILPKGQSPLATSSEYDPDGEWKSAQKPVLSPPEVRGITPPAQESHTVQQPFEQTRMPSRHTIIRRDYDLADRAPDSLQGSINNAPVQYQSGVKHTLVASKKKPEPTRVQSPQGKEDLLKTKDLNRQRIENELQRQRMMAILGKSHKTQTVPPATKKRLRYQFRRKQLSTVLPARKDTKFPLNKKRLICRLNE